MAVASLRGSAEQIVEIAQEGAVAAVSSLIRSVPMNKNFGLLLDALENMLGLTAQIEGGAGLMQQLEEAKQMIDGLCATGQDSEIREKAGKVMKRLAGVENEEAMETGEGEVNK